MATTRRVADVAADRSRRLLADAGRELREARLDRGLSMRAVGLAAGLSASSVSRLERGLVPEASLVELTTLAEAVGLEASFRCFPYGEPIRDVAHVALLSAFRARLHPSLRVAFEVPIRGEGRRAWDMVVAGRGFRVGVEAETAPRDAQALMRRLALKARDGDVDQIVLLVPGTVRVRGFLEAAWPVLEARFALDGDRAMALLAAGLKPGGDAVVVLRRSRRSPLPPVAGRSRRPVCRPA